MWFYKLVTDSGDIYYYDYDELLLAREERAQFGGTIYDRNGKIM